jgi:hypothetical protein
MKFFTISIGILLVMLGGGLVPISAYFGWLTALLGGLFTAFGLLQQTQSAPPSVPAPSAFTGTPSTFVPQQAKPEAPSSPASPGAPTVIHQPRLGLLNLMGEAATMIYLQDLDNLEDIFFQNVDLGQERVPKCNVLFLYCNIEPSGRIAGQKFSLREVVKSAGAQIVVVASENRPEILSGPEFSQYLKTPNDWPVNFIFTVKRNGEAFGLYFQKIFTQMQAGVSMPLAWTQLAPQNPNAQKDCPAAMALLEAGHITLRPI